MFRPVEETTWVCFMTSQPHLAGDRLHFVSVNSPSQTKKKLKVHLEVDVFLVGFITHMVIFFLIVLVLISL